MIDDETRAKALAQVSGLEKPSATEYEDEWAADKEAADAQAAADAGIAAGKKADADPDFNYDEPGTATSTPVKAAEVEAAPIEAAKPLSFKETFAARRKAGDATFQWNGKKYTTDLKKPATSNATSQSVNASPAAAKPAAISAPAASQTLTQKLGSDYAAVKQAADNVPLGASATARSALNEDVTRRQRAYEQAASAEKAGTSVARQAKTPMKMTAPAEAVPMLNIPGKTTLAQGRDPRKSN